MRYGLLLLVPIAAAQTGDPWSSLRAFAPAGAASELKLLDSHPFYQGEWIRADFKLPGRAEPGQPPPDEVWFFAGLLLDPPADCGTVANPCFSARPAMINGLVPARPEPVALNSYLPARLTGRYRVAALSRKQVRIDHEGLGTTYTYAEPAQYAVSNTVELELIAASPEWIAQTIAKSRAVLAGPQPKTEDEHRAWQDAAEQLASLNQPAAWSATLDLLGQTSEGILLQGLAAGEPAEQVCHLMQARVSALAQSVSGSYLSTLSEVCVRAHVPPAPKQPMPAGARAVLVPRLVLSPIPPSAVPVAPVPQEVRDWSAKYTAYVTDLRTKATATLAGSVSRKESGVRWTALIALLEYIRQRHMDQPPQPDPSWLPLLTTEFVSEFKNADVGRKAYLLDLFTSTIDSPDIIPFLESVLDDWKPRESYQKYAIGTPRAECYRAGTRSSPNPGRTDEACDVARYEVDRDAPGERGAPDG